MPSVNFHTLDPNKWAKYAVNIIGGGPSLIGFNFKLLPKGINLGVNDSAILLQTHAMCSVDHGFMGRCYYDTLNYIERGGEVYWGVVESDIKKKIHPINDKIYCIKRFGQKQRQILSTDHTMIGGNMSGIAAINLAFLHGAKTINLFGFDMRIIEGIKHWHNTSELYYEERVDSIPLIQEMDYSFLRYLDDMANFLTAQNIQITNYVGTHGSGIKAFDIKGLESLN